MDRVYEINRDINKYIKKELYTPTGSKYLAYLKETRGLSDDVIDNLNLGCLTDSGKLYTHLKSIGYTVEDILNTGFFRIYGDKIYSPYNDRVIFPIKDDRNRPVAFGGRIIEKNPEKAKYINSPESDIYKKRETLYGLNLIRRAKEVIICEGYMDAIALHNAGFTGAVAPLGTALTEEQINKLCRYTDTLYLCFDNDLAGKKATARAIQRISDTLMFTIRCIDISPVKDPDEFIKQYGADAFRERIDAALSVKEWVSMVRKAPIKELEVEEDIDR